MLIEEEEDDGSTGPSGATGPSGEKLAVVRRGAGLYHSTGPGDLAFYRIIKDCTGNWNAVAKFDCGGEYNSYEDY